MPETVTQMRLRLFASLYWHEGEYEYDPKAPQCVMLWQPLDTDAPEDARPYCYLANDIDFFKPREKWPDDVEDLDHDAWFAATCYQRQVKHYATTRGFGQPVLVYVQGLETWFELGLGEVVWRDGRWYFKHQGRKNTDAANFANSGMLGFNHARQKGHEPGWKPFHKLAPAAVRLAQAMSEADAVHHSNEAFGVTATKLVAQYRKERADA